MILWKISTAIYLYGFLNQSLGLILGNIFLIKITACVPFKVYKQKTKPDCIIHRVKRRLAQEDLFKQTAQL
jgi:hypothetical protein